MFCRAQQAPDLEGNSGQNAGHNTLDFQDPSWIIDHHRHNIITKISKPGDPWYNMLFAQRTDISKTSYHNSERYLNSYGRKIVTDEQQIGSNNQQPQCDIGTTDSHRERNDESYKVNLSELQRLRLRQLQHKLIHHAIDLRYDSMEPPGWAEDLRQYGGSDTSLI
jgi:hypothetical protein